MAETEEDIALRQETLTSELRQEQLQHVTSWPASASEGAEFKPTARLARRRPLQKHVGDLTHAMSESARSLRFDAVFDAARRSSKVA